MIDLLNDNKENKFEKTDYSDPNSSLSGKPYSLQQQ
jgi:hypothetical protein